MTFTEMKVIEKMKKMGKWDAKRDGPGVPTDPSEPNPPPLRKIDSLVESVYNSEKNLEWLP
jgi:hypothetical protein